MVVHQPLWKICNRQIGSWNPKLRGENTNIFELPPPRFPSNHLHQWSFYYQSNQFLTFLAGKSIKKIHPLHQVWSPPKAGQLTIILILPCDFGGFWAWNCLIPPPPPKKCPISWRYLHLPIRRECSWDRQICRWSGFTETPSIMAFNLGSRWVADWPVVEPEVKKNMKKGPFFFKNEWKMAPKNDLKMFFSWKFWSFFSCFKFCCGNLYN